MSFAQRDRLGATSKAPRWVIAYKYETEQQPTVLNDVRWQVGKGGKLTPVGELEPVFIGGVTVSNVTLHNIDQIQRLDLHLGDTVVIERAGEVIPYVVEAVAEKRPKGAKPIEPPTKCPSCGAKVEKEADTPYIRCLNPACPAQLKERLRWFCGRGQMDIEGLGDVLVDQLVEEGWSRRSPTSTSSSPTTSPTSPRKSSRAARSSSGRSARRSRTRSSRTSRSSRKQGLDRLLAGLGIRHVGNRVAYVLARNFGAWTRWPRRRRSSSASVHEIGEVIAAVGPRLLPQPAGKKTIAELKPSASTRRWKSSSPKPPPSCRWPARRSSSPAR